MSLTKIITDLIKAPGFIGPLTGAVTGNCSGSSGSCTGNSSTVTTNANLTGPITSVGNATSIASQTGTGSKFVVDTTPTLITPVLGVASATSVTATSFYVGTVGSLFTDGNTHLRGLATPLWIDTTSSNPVYMQPSGGSVGIGVGSNPTSVVEVAGLGLYSNNESSMHNLSLFTGKTTADYILNIGADKTNHVCYLQSVNYGAGYSPLTLQARGGQVGIGTLPSYLLHVYTDSAGKPGVGGLWTVVSDERVKKDIVEADLNQCYENIKAIPLKYFGWADGVYTQEQVPDRHCLGWIAQDVQKVFPNAVSTKPFTKNVELVVARDTFNTATAAAQAVSLSAIKSIVGEDLVSSEVELVAPAAADFTATDDIIEDCLDLNSGQLIATLYGAVQCLMAKVETLEAQINPPAAK